MSFDYDDKGKIFTDVIRKTTTKAMVQTTSHLIEGNVHVSHDNRLIDELDKDSNFLAITNAVIFGDNKTVLFNAPFLTINRAQIIWILPLED